MSQEKQRVIINDIEADHTVVATCEQLGLNVVDSAEMTQAIMSWSGWDELDPATTLLVFPGKGAMLVHDYMDKEWISKWRTARVYAKREWDPIEDWFYVWTGRVYDHMRLDVKDVVVIDDVVSSGTTARRLFRKNGPWFPGAQWHMLTWVAQRSTAKLRNYCSYDAARWCGTEKTKASINSLSTLRDDLGVALSFSMRNLRNGDGDLFKSMVESLK